MDVELAKVDVSKLIIDPNKKQAGHKLLLDAPLNCRRIKSRGSWLGLNNYSSPLDEIYTRNNFGSNQEVGGR
jgi:hypothetical protein